MTNRTDNQRWHPLITAGRRLVALCAVSLAAGALSLLSGCGTTQSRLTAEDKSQLGRIGIAKAYEKPIVVFEGVPNAVSGGAIGAIGGLLYPPAWAVGGPFLVGPILAAESARCGAQFNNVKDPGQQFEAAVNATRPDELLLKFLAGRVEGVGLGSPSVLETPLKRLDGEKFGVTSISDQSIDTVLQIEQFKVGLAAAYSNKHGGNIRPCFPQVTAEIVWHLIRVRDGKQIATGSDFRSVTSAHRFSAFFQDATLIQTSLNELTEQVASDMMRRSGAN